MGWKCRRTRYEYFFDLKVDRAGEIEILVVDKLGAILGMIWFHFVDLIDFLNDKYGDDRRGLDPDEFWIDLEPSGQLCLKMDFGKLFYG